MFIIMEVRERRLPKTNARTLFQNARGLLKWSGALVHFGISVIKFNCECGLRSLWTQMYCGYWDDLFSGLKPAPLFLPLISMFSHWKLN